MPVRIQALFWLAWMALAPVLLTASAASAQEEDEESPRLPGLIASYSAAGSSAAVRIDETVAFDWQDAAPDPRLPAGAFSAVWRGRLWTQSPGEHRLAVFAQGEVTVKLDGKEVIAGQSDKPAWLVSQPLELEFDYHPLEISYRRSSPRGRLALFWSGPGFVLEPVPERFLFHDRTASPPQLFERGRQLAAVLRCTACHREEGEQNDAMPAPALDRLAGNIEREWLVNWLSSPGGEREGQESGVRSQESARAGGGVRLNRRMPHFGMNAEEAEAAAAWLLRLPAEQGQRIELKETKAAKGDNEQKDAKDAKKKDKKPIPSIEQGERLFLTLGCLACHQHGTLGESGLFGGGDLTKIGAKRPPEFFARWLTDPASLNKHHRMPVFELSADERMSLGLWLGRQGGDRGQGTEDRGQGGIAQGAELIARFRCAACHALPGMEGKPGLQNLKPLTAASDWSRSCGGLADAKANRPGYNLAAPDQAALKVYFSAPRPGSADSPAQAQGRDLLVQLNCLACHQREGIDRQVSALPARLQDKLAAVAEAHSELAKELPAMTPPALNAVGDKLHDSALADAIRRQGAAHRPYLLARMPKFSLTDDQLAALLTYFTTTDRIPALPAALAIQNPKSKIQNPEPRPLVAALTAAGPRLVTADGFGCTSCHQVGGVLPDKAPLNARGPDISMLEKRIRREWFDRWCYSPARIVPRMEMPSVQVPVRGVLNDNVHDQLAAVWQTLNTPGFQPPEPNPIRVLRLSGNVHHGLTPEESKEQPVLLHDVIKGGDKTYLFPLVIGLPNRHNILFDLETNRLAAWWLGDTARQRTKGKSWYWELGSRPIFEPAIDDDEIRLIVAGKELRPRRFGQFAAQPTQIESAANYVRLEQYLEFGDAIGSTSTQNVSVTYGWSAPSVSEDGWTTHARQWTFHGLPNDAGVRLRLVGSDVAERSAVWDKEQRELRMLGEPAISIRTLYGRPVKWNGDGTVTIPIVVGAISFAYSAQLPSDKFLAPAPLSLSMDGRDLEIAPGVAARRLPLPDDITPTAIAWRPGGRLVFTTLKGQVFAADDRNGDGENDSLSLVADGLPTPYGVFANDNYIDVLAKDGLWRLADFETGRFDGAKSRRLVAAGWGVTDDYHDWAVGLVRGENGEYYVGLPCQQDKRSEAAAKHRAQILKLVPRTQTSDEPRMFDIQVLSSGYRFPMGLARNRAGDLFVTDNQGNYNPFNELNHVRSGKHFGFINANEREAGFKPPPLEEPAINIPHPWTRSVNGICFLDTPVGWDKDASSRPQAHQNQAEGGGPAPAAGLSHPTGSAFGPLEGHLIGCEYDTRRLIRMTLQKIGDTYQGAAYPLSIPPDDVEKGLLGPIVCAVSPRGELYVGEIRDSGWGAGNNVGQIVKIKIEPEKLPCGIAEMKATKNGFTLDFFQPVDAAKAADVGNYSLQSYRRESTPAYGGPDLGRRTEKIAAAQVSADKKRVTLKLPELRERFVYELRLKNLAPKGAMFHPDEAHFTLRQIPE